MKLENDRPLTLAVAQDVQFQAFEGLWLLLDIRSCNC